jgi:hypothetical protein
LAQELNIIHIPGSPIEARQYELELQGLSLLTSTWADVESNSQRLVMKGSESDLNLHLLNMKAPLSFQESPGSSFEVIALPILDG